MRNYSAECEVRGAECGSLLFRMQPQTKDALDAHVREIVHWHFSPETGTPFWLDFAKKLDWDPRKEIRAYEDLDRFGFFEDEWLRGGPVRRWVPKAYANKPIYTFETGGSTGVPKSRINIDDFRIDYEMFSDTLPDEHFPKGADWLMVGPSGWSAPQAPVVFASPSNIWRNIAGASASAWTSIPAGSSNSSRPGRWIRSKPTNAT